MAEKLSPGIHHRLSSALSSWTDWTKKPATRPVLTSQLGGESNLTFRVTDGKSDWAVRLNSDIADDGKALQSEIAAHQAANNAGIAPAVIHFNNDFLITEFLEGTRPNLDDLPEIGRLFSRIHAVDVEIQPLDLTKHLQAYFQQAKADTAITWCFDELGKISSAETGIKVLCHHDLTFENLIKTENGILIIDWEYAGLSEPAFDIAVFTLTHELDETRLLQLLDHYDGNEPGLADRIHYFEMVYAMIEILWWRIRGIRLDEKITKFERKLRAKK